MVKPVVEKSLRVVGAGAGLGRADVVQRQLVALVGLDRRLDDQVLAASREADGLAVERQPADREAPAEVELEARRGAGRPERDDRAGLEPAGVGVPRQVEVVEQGVDPRVADRGVDAVLDGLRERGVEVLLDRLGDAPAPTTARPPPARCRRWRRPRRRGAAAGVVSSSGASAPRRAAGEQCGARDERREASPRAHRSPRSRGRASLRPWWIWAFTVPSGAPTSAAISS